MLWYSSYLLVVFILQFTVRLSVHMCCCVMLMAELMNGDLETFGMKLP